MAAKYPRRQAARVAGLLMKSCLPGLTFIEGRPRSGRTDFLLQLFDGLRESAGPAPAFLPLGGRPLDSDGAKQVLAQLAAFADGLHASPCAALDRSRLLDGPDFAAWKPLLAACEAPFSATAFLTALAVFCEQGGPACLLVDDPHPKLLDDLTEAVSLSRSPGLVVVATGNVRPPAGARVLPIEPFSVREVVLLAEAQARSMKVAFSNQAAEPFVACLDGDIFAMETVLQQAALRGESLDSPAAFLRVYGRECSEGSLAAFFNRRMPGQPGSSERRFALELFARETAGTGEERLLDEDWLSTWRVRAPVDDVMECLAALACSRACAQGWVLRHWPAAHHWALAQSGSPLEARGALALKLAAGVRAAAVSAVAQERAKRVQKALFSLADHSQPLLIPGLLCDPPAMDVRDVRTARVEDADLFLCFGLTHRSQPALLAVALVNATDRFARVLLQLDQRIAAAQQAARTDPGPVPVEKWLVCEAQVSEAEVAACNEKLRSRGVPPWKQVDFQRFNEFVSGPAACAPKPEQNAIEIRLPAQPEMEIAAVRVLDHMAEREHWPESFLCRSRVALVEACLNAMEQVSRQPGSQPGKIDVRLAISGGQLIMSVSNPGAPFEAGEETESQVSGAAIHRGHGLKIIRSFVDDLRFFADLKGTRIEMRKIVPDNRNDSAGQEARQAAAASDAGISEDKHAGPTKRE